MGHVHVRARVENTVEGISREYELLADTGASYLVLRRKEFEELRLKPIGEVRATLADKRAVKVPIAPVNVSSKSRRRIY